MFRLITVTRIVDELRETRMRKELAEEFPRQLLSCSGKLDHSVRLLQGHTNKVMGLRFLPGGRLLSASHDNTMRLWDLATGRCLRTLADHEDWVNSVAFGPDGMYALSGGGDPSVRLWDSMALILWNFVRRLTLRPRVLAES